MKFSQFFAVLHLVKICYNLVDLEVRQTSV